MERAGAAVAEAVAARWPEGPVAVLCGPGTTAATGSWPRAAGGGGASVRLALLGERRRWRGRGAGGAVAGAARSSGWAQTARPERRSWWTPCLARGSLRAAGRDGPRGAANAERARPRGRRPAVGLRATPGALGWAPTAADRDLHRKKPAHVLSPARLCGEGGGRDIGSRRREGRAARERAGAVGRGLSLAARAHAQARARRLVVVGGGPWSTARRGWRRAGA
jgi:NAD(P)H-hydrate epimerase